MTATQHRPLPAATSLVKCLQTLLAVTVSKWALPTSAQAT